MTRFDEIEDRLDDIEVQLDSMADTIEEINSLLRIIISKLGMEQ
jgi:uncharacterized coiled-coil protein SlyX